jgi:hypothetical protein
MVPSRTQVCLLAASCANNTSCETCTASIIIHDMGLKITPEVRKFYKQLASEGGKARAKKYDHATLSEWAKRGGRPRKKLSMSPKRTIT